MGVYILHPHATGILYAPPPLFYTPPTPRRVFQGWGGRVYKIRPRIFSMLSFFHFLIFLGFFLGKPALKSEVPPVLLGIFMTSSGCSMEGGRSKKGNGTNRTGGSTILRLIWGETLLYFPGFGDLRPYETCKFRIFSESVSGVFPDLFRISLRKCLTVLGAPPITTPKPALKQPDRHLQETKIKKSNRYLRAKPALNSMGCQGQQGNPERKAK